ncbi:MAG: hypothetical protein HUJ67_03625 [Ruminiclostridium sp.]|nr:hypothetical protein [Ruminiclostridium sp.]
MFVILLDPEMEALEAMAGHIFQAEPEAEIVGFTDEEELAQWLEENVPSAGGLRVQTFGNFEVFFDGKPVHFSRSRTKELFAYLIDRRGAGSTMGQLISVLWEGRPDTESVRSQLRSLISDLRATFRALDREDVIIKRRDLIAVNPDRVDCDYYRFLRGEPAAVETFRGEYMSNYSWGETTLGALQQRK